MAVPKPKETSVSFTLRPYQHEAVQNVMADLETLQKVAMIMPTGSGKTEVFLKIAERYLAQNPEKAVLVLSHLSLLTKQTFDRFTTRAPHLPAGIFQAGQYPDFRTKVIIGTMQTSRSASRVDDLNLVTKWPVGLIIIDEAHFLMSDSYDKAISYFPMAKQVGCTATPFRSGALMTSYFDKISFSISLQDLITQGFLVPPRLIEISKGDGQGGDDDVLEEKLAETAKLYTEKERGKKAIIFMPTIESAKTMRNLLDNAGVKAHAITSELVGEERDTLLSRFRQGEIDVLTTVNVLTAGFDSPNVEAIFMPYPTQSPTVYLQRIGRGLRVCPEIGKSECRIYVYGDAPSIKRGVFQKLHENVLDTGSKKHKTTTFEEDLAYNEADPSSEVYLWTEKVVSAIERMKRLGMDKLAGKLNEKKFPKRFLQDIGAFATGLPSRLPSLPGGQYMLTAEQEKTLRTAGFTEECLEGVSKNEASAMIAAVLNQKNDWRKKPFIIPSGKFSGQHIKHTTFYYRNWIMKNNPNGEIAKLIKEWEGQGGRYEKR